MWELRTKNSMPCPLDRKVSYTYPKIDNFVTYHSFLDCYIFILYMYFSKCEALGIVDIWRMWDRRHLLRPLRMQFYAQLWLDSNDELGTSRKVWLRLSVFSLFSAFYWTLINSCSLLRSANCITWKPLTHVFNKVTVSSWHYDIDVSALTIIKLLASFSLLIISKTKCRALRMIV